MFPASPNGVRLKENSSPLEGFNIKEKISVWIYPTGQQFVGIIMDRGAGHLLHIKAMPTTASRWWGLKLPGFLQPKSLPANKSPAPG
jgi:hypothetical protein